MDINKDVPINAVELDNEQLPLALGEGGTTDYNELNNQPVLNTTYSQALSPMTNEVLKNTINLHKISKTGTLSDAIDDETHRTVTDNEKSIWNNKSDFDGDFGSLTNVPAAGEGVAGVVQLATDLDVNNGSNVTKAITPKQLKTAIDGLGTVFDLKGTKSTQQDLPTSGNTIGDVWYVVAEQVGYIWLNDGTQNKWEKFGAPIDLSGYVQYVDIINVLTSTDINKPLSAMQGKVLNDQIMSLMEHVGTNQQNISTLQQTMAKVQVYDSESAALAASQADPNKICLY